MSNPRDNQVADQKLIEEAVKAVNALSRHIKNEIADSMSKEKGDIWLSPRGEGWRYDLHQADNTDLKTTAQDLIRHTAFLRMNGVEEYIRKYAKNNDESSQEELSEVLNRANKALQAVVDKCGYLTKTHASLMKAVVAIKEAVAHLGEVLSEKANKAVDKVKYTLGRGG